MRNQAEQRRAENRRDHRHQTGERTDRAQRLALAVAVGGRRNQALHRSGDGIAEDIDGDHRVHHPAFGRRAP